jgi:hypothetical protein
MKTIAHKAAMASTIYNFIFYNPNSLMKTIAHKAAMASTIYGSMILYLGAINVAKKPNTSPTFSYLYPQWRLN